MYKIYFPVLHPSLGGDVDEKVLFLNPGIVKEECETKFYTPKKLPLTYKESEKYLKQLIQYGEMFKTPGEISQTFLLQLYRGEEETPSYIKSKIRGAGEKGKNKKEFPIIGQLTLLLQWFLEENILELEKLNKEIKEDMEKLKRNIGEGREETDLPLFTEDTKKELMKILPWKRLLPWFFLFVEKSYPLIVEDNNIIEEWIDYGLEVKREISTGATIIKEKGWKFLLKNREVEDMQWLNGERIIIVRTK